MQVSHSNIPDDVMHDAHKAYQIVHTDFTENSRLITNSNLWKVLYQIWNRHLKPLDPNPERILHWMMQTGQLPFVKLMTTFCAHCSGLLCLTQYSMV